MNQAILKIIDEEIKIYKSFTTPIAGAYAEVGVMVLEGIRDKISSLPSDTQWIDAKVKPILPATLIVDMFAQPSMIIRFTTQEEFERLLVLNYQYFIQPPNN